ncbi:hypothetical protein, partial [Nostoc commune]|uniref:hypothetical protein n=1 Tax=Nostoc commune TaxID=1178 RepID=UPI0018C517B8
MNYKIFCQLLNPQAFRLFLVPFALESERKWYEEHGDDDFDYEDDPDFSPMLKACACAGEQRSRGAGEQGS